MNSPFYSQLPGIDIEELLWFIAEKTGFLRDFTHALDRYVKHEPNPREILACIGFQHPKHYVDGNGKL